MNDIPRTNEWETYCDESYYHLWRVRRKNERGFNDGYHVQNGEGARQLVELLNKQDSKLTAARAEMPWYANGESKEEWMERQREKYQHLENTIKEVTEQRDQLLRYNEAFRKETLICADCDAISKEEYDRAIEQRDGLRSGIDYASDQLHKVNEQLKEAKEIYQKSYSAELARSNHYKEQRDKMVEALERILEYQGRFAEEDPQGIAREALQSLNQPKKYDANEHQSFYP